MKTPFTAPKVPPTNPLGAAPGIPVAPPVTSHSSAPPLWQHSVGTRPDPAYKPPVLRGARRPCAGKVEQRPSVVGNQNGEHLNGDQFFQNRFRRETQAPLVDEHS